MPVRASDIIRKIVKEKAKSKGLSLRQLSRLLGVSNSYLHSIFNGDIVSRPLIRRISKLLDIPELPDIYEKFLHEKRMAGKQVESKAGVSTGEKEGGS